MEETKRYFEGLGVLGCIVVFVVAVGLVIFEGWLLSALWNWIAPMFWAGAPVLDTCKGLGIMLILDFVGSLLFRRRDDAD